MNPGDITRLGDPEYFANIVRLNGTEALRVHEHSCPQCHRVIRHTKLEALRDGDLAAHTCCGVDVRPARNAPPQGECSPAGGG